MVCFQGLMFAKQSEYVNAHTHSDKPSALRQFPYILCLHLMHLHVQPSSNSSQEPYPEKVLQPAFHLSGSKYFGLQALERVPLPELQLKVEREQPFGLRRSQHYKLYKQADAVGLHDRQPMLLQMLGFLVCVMLVHGLTERDVL